MASQLDLDQGGTFRQWVLDWMGPTVGYVWRPAQNILTITVAGSYTIDRSTNYIPVSVAGSVTINLPSTSQPSTSQRLGNVQPALFQRNPITIYDIGGNAAAFPIVIQGIAGDTVIGLSSIQLSVNYGSYVLQPDPAFKNWVNIA